VVAEESNVFKSAMHPLRLTFLTTAADGTLGESIVIFKKGDDLRQVCRIYSCIQAHFQ
jgi:hypothetical protein